MSSESRPDLPNRGLYMLLAVAGFVLLLTLYLFDQQPPGSPAAQWGAAIGVLLLLVPMLFSVLKRGGMSNNPPFWFVTHVLCATLGICLILFHVSGGNWASPPGLVLFLMLFLLIQGVWLRTSISKSFSHLFARRSVSQGFAIPAELDREVLAATIDKKTGCLRSLDPSASEALFSPTLRHWLTHPWLSFRYQSLINTEAQIVGVRESAGPLLAWSRRVHLFVAAAFYFGLLTHIVIVLFFAGYAAGGEEIDWWYITDWGGGTPARR